MNDDRKRRRKNVFAPRRSLSRGSDRSPSSSSLHAQTTVVKSQSSFFDIFFSLIFVIRYKKSLHSSRRTREKTNEMFAMHSSLAVVGAPASSSAKAKASRSRSSSVVASTSFSRSRKISIAPPKSNPTRRRKRTPFRARVDEDDEEMDFERPPPPPGPENEAMESETFSNAWKAGFVVLSVLGAVSVFSLASPVLRVMTETFPAGRGPQ